MCCFGLLHTCTHMDVSMNVCMYACADPRICVLCVIYTYTHMLLHVYTPAAVSLSLSIYIYMHITIIHTYNCLSIYTYAYIIGVYIYIFIYIHVQAYSHTVEARKLEHDRPPFPKPKKEGQPAHIILHPCSNFLELAVHLQASFFMSTPSGALLPPPPCQEAMHALQSNEGLVPWQISEGKLGQ